MSQKTIFICDKCKKEFALASFTYKYVVESIFQQDLCNDCWKLCREIMLAAIERFKLVEPKQPE